MDEQDRLIELVRRLMKRSGSLQSAGAAESIDNATLEEHLRGSLAPDIARNVAGTLERVAAAAPASRLSRVELANLEAIVHVLGRPAMRYANGRVMMPPDKIGYNERWRVVVAISRSEINTASASVGRVILGGGALPALQGTGWRIGADLVVTNRHVACALVENPSDDPAAWRIHHANQPAMDFGTANSRFAIAACTYCAPDPDLDFAVLRLATTAAAALPAPLKIGLEAPASQGGEIYVVGHPYRAWASSASASVFGAADGSKRWSPGYITSLESGSTFEHDCSTLGGSSGSCMFATGTHRVIGLHMGGRDVDELTGQGAANRALDFAQLPAGRELEILKTGKV